MTSRSTSQALPSDSQYHVVGDDVPETTLFDPADVIKGLRRDPKRISSIYYYDDRGSLLFEQLSCEPTYYLTRTESRIIEDNAHHVAELVGRSTIVELGCGNGSKSRHLLSGFIDAYRHVTYMPIDINRSILVKNIEAIGSALGGVTINAIVGTYRSGLSQLAKVDGPKCVVFLGSTIGNMEDAEIAELLEWANSVMDADDYFLVGADLDKDSATLEAAYNNQTAILTNLAVLQHLNWRFNGNFDLFRFRHIAFHNVHEHRIESHLEATEPHQVKLEQLHFSCELKKGERIRTEISRKFLERDFVSIFEVNGFRKIYKWNDDNALCGLYLFAKVGAKREVVRLGEPMS